MKIRIALTAVLLFGFTTITAIYNIMRAPIEGAAAVHQLNDSAVEYSISREVAMGHFNKFAWLSLLIILGLIWVPVIIKKIKKNSLVSLLFCLSFTASISACGPAKIELIKEIESHQTAFLVPLEGATMSNQAKFMSIDYLNSAKVASKRVIIPTRQHDTGRGPGNYEWIPTLKFIVVDRTPVTRVWTQSKHTGTSPSNEAICVESLESVDFCVGVTAITNIKEEDAAKFLYYYAGKPLDKVMDQDVRGYASTILAREFGSRTLDQGRREKNIIFSITKKETEEFFETRGVTLMQLGSSEGLQYSDPKIQDAINQTFVAENDKIKAVNEKAAQDTRNEMNVNMAVANRKAAEEFAKAKEAQVARIGLDIEMKRAEAMLEAAKNLKDLKGQLPSVLPQGSTLLFGLDKPIKDK